LVPSEVAIFQSMVMSPAMTTALAEWLAFIFPFLEINRLTVLIPTTNFTIKTSSPLPALPPIQKEPGNLQAFRRPSVIEIPIFAL
jgi:hypothetical protein